MCPRSRLLYLIVTFISGIEYNKHHLVITGNKNNRGVKSSESRSGGACPKKVRMNDSVNQKCLDFVTIKSQKAGRSDSEPSYRLSMGMAQSPRLLPAQLHVYTWCDSNSTHYNKIKRDLASCYVSTPDIGNLLTQRGEGYISLLYSPLCKQNAATTQGTQRYRYKI